VPFYSDNIRDLLKMHVRDEPPDIAELVPGLAPGLVKFIRGALIKRPDERLTDWPTILGLLEPSAGWSPNGEVAARSTGAAVSEVVSISFPVERTGEVEAAVESLVAQLAPLPDVEVATARLVPLREVAGEDEAALLDSSAGASTLNDPIEP